MFVWIPVSSRWRYQYDTVLMHRGIQGDIIYMYDEFGVHGKLYVEVKRTWCFMAKHENGSHHDTTIFDIGESFWYFWCSRSEDDTEWIGSLWCSICRRSSLKYEAWKLIKMGVKGELWIKIADFLLEWEFGNPMFIARLVMIHMHTKCQSCMCMWEAGLGFLIFKGAL